SDYSRRQDNIVDKKECLKQCDHLGNILISTSFRNHPDFNKFLSQSIELLFQLCNNDDIDVHNVVQETFDKIIGNLIEFNSNRLLSELCKGITKFSSNRSLRLSLTKFAEICHRIRPNKYRAFTMNLYSSFLTILIDFCKDELVQESLYTAICKIYPLLTPYATEREIFDIMNAYLINLSSSSNTIRRYSSISIVILCDSARKSDHYFNVALNHVSNLISTSIKSNNTENKDYLLTGIFMMAKCSFSKLIKYLDPNEHPKLFDSLLKNLSYIYQQMILTMKHATNNILIIAILEALAEFFNVMPEKIFQMFTDLCEEEMEFKHISSFRSSVMKSVNNDSLVNLENLNDEFEDDTFEKAGIYFSNAGSTVDLYDDVSEASENMFSNSLIENTGSMIFDHESEIDTKSIGNKTPEFDLSSEASSLNTTSHKCLNSPFDISSSFDLIITENQFNSIDLDDYNLGPLFSFEHVGKLICLKYLLKGQSGQLMTDTEVRVAIKSLSLSCLTSIVQHCPKILLDKIVHKKTSQQLINDILLYSTHSDPNIRGHIAMIIGKYLQHNNNNNDELSLDSLLNLLEKFLLDSSSITIRQVLISLQQFLPILIEHNEINIIQIFNLIHQLICLKDNSYWLIKIELITLFAKISIPYLKHMEFILKSNADEWKLLKIPNHHLKHVPITKLILEEILFHFIFDSDYRVRQATLNLLPNFIDNICLNNYVFQNDCINLLKKFFYKLRQHYHCKQTLTICLNSLCTLSRLYPPNKHSNGWLIESNDDQSKHNSVEMIMLLIEILTKNPMILNDLSIQQNLAELIMNLIEGVCINYFHQLQNHHSNKIHIESTNYLHQMISIEFAQCIETFFLYLYKIIVIYSAINEDNPLIFTTFIHNLYTRRESISAIIRKHSTSFFDMNKDKHRKEPSAAISSSSPFSGTKASRRREALAFDSISFRLFEILKNHRNHHHHHHHHHRKSATISARTTSDKSSHLNTMLIIFSKLLEFTSSSFLCNHLEDILIYLKMIFYMNPSATIKTINQLMKCIFEINYISLFMEIFNHNDSFRNVHHSHHYRRSRGRRNTKSKSLSIELNSLYNICFVIPYMKYNDFQSIGGNVVDHSSSTTISSSTTLPSISYLNWLRKWIEYKYIKIMNSDVTRGISIGKNSDFCLKKFLTTKIQCFEPLVIQSMKHYAFSNDIKFQSIILDLFVQLIQFHINYSLLDSENFFISFIMKQFEQLEMIYDSGPYELLMKHVFHFLATLSAEHYINDDLVSIPKIIQLCDNLIANGHQCLAIDGLHILIEHIFNLDFSSSSSKLSNNSNLTTLINDELFMAIETQKEVIVAYCFKLINQKGTFKLLTLILQHYKHCDPIKWNDLSQQILDIIIGKLLTNHIRIDSQEYFNSLQSLLATLSLSSSSQSLLEIMFNEYRSYQNSQILFKHWLPKILMYLKIILMDMNETTIMKEIDYIKMKMNIIILNPVNNCTGDCLEKIDSEDIFAYFLLNLLQKIIMEIDSDISNGNYYYLISNNNNNIVVNDHKLIVTFYRHYHMILVSLFQSGFYPRLTRSATLLIRQQPKSEYLSLNNETFNLRMVNEIFLKITKFYPFITISWLNFLYILNYDRLAKILSKCIERNKINIFSNGNNMKSKQTTTTITTTTTMTKTKIINWEILKRCSLILLCDYLSENLENVEFLSWFIINYLHEIIEHCHEMPIKEFINTIHRKPVSSGLLLQVISSKCDELFNTNNDSPLMVQKILYCLERSHNRQNIALIMFLIERYICNIRLSLYYKCCKYAETIIIDRLNLIYDYKSRKSTKKQQQQQQLLFSFDDFNNLLKIVKHTSYNKLYFTLKMIRVRFYDTINDNNSNSTNQQQQQRFARKKRHHHKDIKDPLRLKRIAVPDMDKNWFKILIGNQLSQRRQPINITNIMTSLERLTNNDIIDLIFSSKFSFENFIIILKLIVEKHQQDSQQQGIVVVGSATKQHKQQQQQQSLDAKEMAKFIVPIYCRFLQSILERFPLIHLFNMNNNNVDGDDNNVRKIDLNDIR
uniref:Huntingtin-like n=1 Tax=Dermatophagoides pteronyssinus TaxID=6956 RepID=A0A6P6Y7E8_DERPT